MSKDPNDNEDLYQAHLAALISRTKSRGHGRYFNKFVNKCRDEAAAAYPKGAAEAARKSTQKAGFAGILAALFAFLG